MNQRMSQPDMMISAWQRNLLTAAAVLTVALISAGGILCATGSIRSCPDWPGCFGKLYPPLALSPILEYAHRILAALTGLSVFGAAVTGLVKTSHIPWLVIAPIAASLLVIEVSIFGALVVIRGLTPGWAAVDLGSALLVVTLMVSTAVAASSSGDGTMRTVRLPFSSWPAILALITVGIVYLLLVSGVLLAAENAVVGCIGWPIFSPLLYQQTSHSLGYLFRLGLSIIALIMVAVVEVQAFRYHGGRPAVIRSARLVALGFIVELGLQIMILILGFTTLLVAVYSVTMAVTWGLLIVLVTYLGIEEGRSQAAARSGK
ncbi:MAG: COX15/CtaA family protein [Anaerolineae bacterium]